MDQNQTLLDLQTKVDLLTQQMQAQTDYIRALTEFTEAQMRRQREWDDLRADLTPIVNDLYLVAVEQMAELEPHVQLEDLLNLLKRLARNTRTIERMLDQLESLSDLLQDASPIVNEAVFSLIAQMDAMEQRGYFRLAREGQYVLDNIVAAFGPQDVRQLGDNIVTILTTIKEMTQPEVMTTVQSLAHTVRRVEAQPPAGPTSLWSLLKQMRDPQVRRGLALTMEILRTVGEEPPPAAKTNGK